MVITETMHGISYFLLGSAFYVYKIYSKRGRLMSWGTRTLWRYGGAA